jgi:FkbM family methyltransferase
MHESLTGYIQEAGLEIQAEGTVVFPGWVKRIKIDVGLSYSASNSIEWIREDPNLMVFGFEPHKESCEALRKLISKQGDSEALERQLVILPVALGSYVGTAQLHVTADDSASSSLLAPKRMAQLKSVTVPVFTLVDLLQSIPWNRFARIDYLKLDCQGLDLEILKSTGREWIKKIAIVTAEPEDEQYKNSTNGIRALKEFMKSSDFIYFNARSAIRVFLGRLLAKLTIVRALKIRLPVSRAREVASDRASLVVDDPTFINRSFLNEVMAGEITGFQKG